MGQVARWPDGPGGPMDLKTVPGGPMAPGGQVARWARRGDSPGGPGDILSQMGVGMHPIFKFLVRGLFPWSPDAPGCQVAP